MEKVYVECVWYDGPRAGVADYNSIPHRFISNFNDIEGYEDTFKLFPISDAELQLEIEQWTIFVDWNSRYEKEDMMADTHPGHGGVNQRYDEIEFFLKEKRKTIPENYIDAKAEFLPIEQQSRYESTGPSYGVNWIINGEKA